MGLKIRKCRQCGEEYKQTRPLQVICSFGCAAQYARKQEEKKERKETAEKKKGLLTHGDYLKLLETVFNTYIRERDKDKPCISCDKPAGQYTLTAGHFWPAGNYSFLRFHEDNVNGQCWWNCNKNKHGNVGEYRIRLTKKIGEARVKYLDDNREKDYKLSIPEIKELIREYKFKLKELRK